MFCPLEKVHMEDIDIVPTRGQGVKSLLYHTSLTDLMLLTTSKMNLVNDVLS